MIRRFGCFVASAVAGGLYVGSAVVSSPAAEAAQVYVCMCDGERKRFLASTRYCEKQNKVKQCTKEQYRKTYTRACRERGCRLP